ncbi:hypothetical protein [Magnetospirillum molischianum]|uniref:Uncharacterized protein n=1 Tax=Magnetospirillum molischianum DSM 120 TaxID=1150626 RepID=H8FU36_MAGML|nr:hypothetical protein [Magnetospirillum molischianum]CCG41874.1 hypothetical protein PHAMO_30030 [Magnetospirillum molischianum DSM 120]
MTIATPPPSASFRATPVGVSTRGAPDPWRSGEPALADVLADPIVHLLMRRDGLTADDVLPLLTKVGRGLGRRLCPLTAKAA